MLRASWCTTGRAFFLIAYIAQDYFYHMILVTGGSGFLGSYLIRSLLKKDFRVRAIKRPDSNLSPLADLNSKIEWINCDVRDPLGMEEAMNGVEKLYHCASMVSFNSRKRKEMYSVNVEGTANVMNAALNMGVKKVLHVSSIATFGRVKGGAAINENTRWTESAVNSHYSKSKFRSEREVWRAMAEGLNGVIVNPAVILGAWFPDKGTSKFFNRVLQGQRFYTEGVNAFVDVRDCVSLMIQLMESEISNQRFIISSENLSYRTLLEKIAHHLNKKAPTKNANNFLLQSAVFAERIRSRLINREPLINPETARIGQEKYFYDNSKIINALQFKFKPIEETIKETAEKFMESTKQKSAVSIFD